MRYVERDLVEPPKAFASDSARASRRALLDFFALDSERVKQSRYESKDWAVHDPEVRDALMELFRGRCAFCESAIRRSPGPFVHRYRPPANAEPATDLSVSHLYYSWLSEAWQNLYPICPECLPTQPEFFPLVSGKRVGLPSPAQLDQYISRQDGRWPQYPVAEKPVLLDPCEDRTLWRHLEFRIDGSVHARDRRGKFTIEHHSLNRQELRFRRRNSFEDQVSSLMEYLTGNRGFSRGRNLLFEEIDFGGAWQILLRNLLRSALRSTVGDDLEIAFEALMRRRDGAHRLGLVLEEARDSVDDRTSYSLKSDGPEVTFDFVNEIPSSISIQDFKSLEAISFDMPPAPQDGVIQAPSLLILGENAAGKSTILEAIATALMSPDQRRLLKLRSGRLVLDPKYMGAEKQHRRKFAEIRIGYGRPLGYLRIEPHSPQSASEHFAQDFIHDGPRNDIPIFAYGAFRQYLETRRKFTPHRHIRSLFESDELLSNPERWLLALHPDRFRMVARALREVFAVDGEFEVLKRTETEVLVVEQLHQTGESRLKETPLGIVSSGFRAVLAMLCDILQGLMDKRVNPGFQALETARGIVLIDEIEAHLHPRWKMAIMTGLRRALPQVTFIATSHDPLCLRGMRRDEVMVLQRIPGDEADTDLPVFTQSLVDLPDNQNWTIEQLLTADFFKLRSTENVEAEKRIARMEDKLAQGLKPEDDAELREFLTEISSSLPIGDTDVHRIVQEAVAEFLARRRTATDEKLRALRDDTKKKIIAALEGST